MKIKDILSKLNELLKSDPLDKKQIINHINLLTKGYNQMINKFKESSTDGDAEKLKDEIKQSEKKYKKKVIDLNTIFEIAKELSSSLYLMDLMKTIILTSMGHMLAETGVVFVLDEKLRKYIFQQAKGTKEDLGDISFDSKEEIIKFLIAKSKPVTSKDISAEDFGVQYKEILSKLNCELIVPIHIKDKYNGILFLGPKPGGMPFTESNIEFLNALGSFSAIAIENARLYADIDRKMKDLSTLYNISKEINKSVETEVVLNLMIETITTGFGVEKCSVVLYDELKNVYHIEKNINITDEDAQNKLNLILEKKIENPLEQEEPGVILNKDLLGNDELYLSIPLTAGNKKVGLLNIYQFKKDIIINEDSQQIFSIIASQMAPPIVLTQYLSKRETYKENPFDYIYNMITDNINTSNETGVGFITSRIKLDKESINFTEIKNFIEKVKPILQDTDTLIHSNYNELVILFPATTKTEVKSLIDNILPSLGDLKVEHNLIAYPDDVDNIESILNKLFNN